MKKISQEEFEKKVQELIDEKTSRTKLASELETDSRTLNNKIQELCVYNPDLYLAFIKKYPYKQKERDDIDYEALVIEIIKTRMPTLEAARKYNVGERTIRRKVKLIEQENPELIAIYKEVKNNNKHGRENSLELQSKVSDLVLRPVKVSEINEHRKKELEEIETIFNKRCEHVSKEEAAKSMGMTANRVYKLLNELYRIQIEESYQEETSNKNANFKDSLKFNSSNNTTIKFNPNASFEETNKDEKEGIGIGEE